MSNLKNNEGDPCAYIGCQEIATTLACGRECHSWAPDEPEHPDPAWYCDKHASQVFYEGSSEFVVICPCCGCSFGVD